MCISAPDATAARGAQGVIVYFRVVDGAVRVGDTVKLMKSRKEYQVDELGVLAPKPVQARACPRARARSRPRCWLWGAPRARARARRGAAGRPPGPPPGPGARARARVGSAAAAGRPTGHCLGDCCAPVESAPRVGRSDV